MSARSCRGAELSMKKTFRHVSYGWDAAKAAALDPVGRARMAWQRLLLGDQAWAEDQVRSLVDLTRQLTELGEIDTALEGLMAVAITAWWTNFDSTRRELIAGAVSAIPVREDDPRVLSILGFAVPLERGAVVLDRFKNIVFETVFKEQK